MQVGTNFQFSFSLPAHPAAGRPGGAAVVSLPPRAGQPAPSFGIHFHKAGEQASPPAAAAPGRPLAHGQPSPRAVAGGGAGNAAGGDPVPELNMLCQRSRRGPQ